MRVDTRKYELHNLTTLVGTMLIDTTLEVLSSLYLLFIIILLSPLGDTLMF